MVVNMSSEETYLNDLLKSLSESAAAAESMESASVDGTVEGAEAKAPVMNEDPAVEEPGMEEMTTEEPNIGSIGGEAIMLDELNLDSIEIPEIPEIPDIPDIELPEISELLDDGPDTIQSESPEILGGDIEESEVVQEANMDFPELGEDLNPENIEMPDLPELGEDLNPESMEMPDLPELGEDLNPENIEMPDLPELGEDLNPESMEMPDLPELGEDLSPESIEIPDLPELGEDLNPENMEMPDLPELGEDLNLESMEMPDFPELEEDLNPESIETPENPKEEPVVQNDLSIDGLDEAIQSETELEMAGELNIDELDFGEMDSAGLAGDELNLPDDNGAADADEMDDSLEDVLNMLDDDAELAEINDMLKRSDNNEPIQDDMMDILNQMADDEAASVNAGVKHVDDEDDGGVPLPVIPTSMLNSDGAGLQEESSEDSNPKKKGKKGAKKKKGSDADNGAGSAKETGKLGKLFNLLTEELVPEPTEEELAAEKEAKEAKKKENLTKKEEEKLAKEEEKKAKAEEKAAADKAKQEAAAQKKKEKQAAKEAKLAAKKAKEAKEGPKKRIPPKKIAAAAVFGATVGGAVILSTNILSAQGYLHTARNAFYDQDYKTVYQSTFGMELDDTESDGLIKAKSEVILKIQRRYDSYRINMKMGREIEALDALLQGIATYDFINADAEKYGVAAEVDTIKTDILSTLASQYNIDEAKARELINTEDALTYSLALDSIISGR